MKIFTCALIADGSSDRALIPLIKLLLIEHLQTPFEEPQLIQSDKPDLASKIEDALDKFAVDILFIHRDAENEDYQHREAEIHRVVPIEQIDSVVCVVPIKMTETWLLTDPAVIRCAVGNPNSAVALPLPNLAKLEACQAKEVLFQVLTIASEFGAQRRRKFKPEKYRHRVAELTSDLKLLRRIPSFKRFEDALLHCLKKIGESVEHH